MTKRPRRNHQPGLQGEGGFWPLSRARRRWPNWPNNSMSIQTRLTTLEIATSRRGLPGSLARDETRFKSARDRCERCTPKIGELTLENEIFCPERSGKPDFCRAQSDDRPER